MTGVTFSSSIPAMRSRLSGILVILLAMTAVITGRGLLSASTAGQAVPLEVSGPPRPGDCVMSAGDPGELLAAGSDAQASVVFGPCRGVVAGEIVSVGRAAPPDPHRTVGVVLGTAGECWVAAARYAGFVVSAGVADLTPIPGEPLAWKPFLAVRGQRVEADSLQKAAGRDWSACLVRPIGLGVYLGSVRAALVSGRAPAGYGSCTDQLDPTRSDPVPCPNPHVRERLGWVLVPVGEYGRAELDQSCARLAARLLRTDDPTYRGQLDIHAVSGNLTLCVADTRGPVRLTGSLIGLGQRALPVAG